MASSIAEEFHAIDSRRVSERIFSGFNERSPLSSAFPEVAGGRREQQAIKCFASTRRNGSEMRRPEKQKGAAESNAAHILPVSAPLSRRLVCGLPAST